MEQIQQIVADVVTSNPDGDNIQSVSIFGSFLRGDSTSTSDVDLLFETNKTMSLFQIGGIHNRLEHRLGRKVDFVPKNSVIPQLRDVIIPGSKIIYERK